jgi:hypothetical protein
MLSLAVLRFLLASTPALDARLVAETAAGETREVPLQRLPVASLDELECVVLHVLGTPPPPAADPAARADVRLAAGDRLQGRIAGGEGESLSLAIAGGVVLPIPIERLASLVFPARLPEGRAAAVAAPPELDRVYRRVGGSLDSLDGTVLGFAPEGVRIEAQRLGATLVPWGEVAALFIETLGEGAEAASAPGAPVSVDLVDGGRLSGRMQGLSSAGISLSIAGAAAVLLPLNVLGEVSRDDGSVAFLSDLEALFEEGRGNPFEKPAPGEEVLGMVWPRRADRAVHGAPLTAGGRIARRGIGVQAPSRIGFALPPGFRALHGSVAIDDSVLLEPARGSVIFRLWLDDERVWESVSLSAGDPPVAFPPIALAGKRELVLEADMAADLNQGDRADWLRMMLVR